MPVGAGSVVEIVGTVEMVVGSSAACAMSFDSCTPGSGVETMSLSCDATSSGASD